MSSYIGYHTEDRIIKANLAEVKLEQNFPVNCKLICDSTPA